MRVALRTRRELLSSSVSRLRKKNRRRIRTRLVIAKHIFVQASSAHLWSSQLQRWTISQQAAGAVWRIIRPDWKRTTRSHISWALSNCYKWGLGCEVKSQREPCSHLLGAKANQPLAPVANESMISSNQAVWKPNTVSVPHAICHLLTVLSAQIYLNSDKRSAGCLFWPLIWWCNQMRRQRPTVWAQTVSVVSFPQILSLICVLWSKGAAHSLMSLPSPPYISIPVWL